MNNDNIQDLGNSAHFEFIKRKLVDDRVPVTFKSLSRHLNININESKKLLEDFSAIEGDEHSIVKLYVYLGNLSTGKRSISVMTKSKWKDIDESNVQILSSHVYSIEPMAGNDELAHDSQQQLFSIQFDISKSDTLNGLQSARIIKGTSYVDPNEPVDVTKTGVTKLSSSSSIKMGTASKDSFPIRKEANGNTINKTMDNKKSIKSNLNHNSDVSAAATVPASAATSSTLNNNKNTMMKSALDKQEKTNNNNLEGHTKTPKSAASMTSSFFQKKSKASFGVSNNVDNDNKIEHTSSNNNTAPKLTGQEHEVIPTSCSKGDQVEDHIKTAQKKQLESIFDGDDDELVQSITAQKRKNVEEEKDYEVNRSIVGQSDQQIDKLYHDTMELNEAVHNNVKMVTKQKKSVRKRRLVRKTKTVKDGKYTRTEDYDSYESYSEIEDESSHSTTLKSYSSSMSKQNSLKSTNGRNDKTNSGGPPEKKMKSNNDGQNKNNKTNQQQKSSGGGKQKSLLSFFGKK